MTARGKARKRALDVLFSAELRAVSPLVTLRERTMAEGAANDRQNPYVATLVEGVVAHQERIDELLSTYSSGWSLERMPVVDRNVLRIAVFELLWREDIPAPVVIDEAVSLVRSLSTDASPGFVNGVLARILDLRPRLAV
ncbi:MAG: transcription antitermination factor NusB [Candidatus Nanopelagicales bacterium]